MKEVDKLIEPLIDSQFPEFYREEGPLFILFLKEYYAWLSTKEYLVNGTNVAGQALYHSRSLPEYRDIDRTVDDYIIYFKEKYLKGIDFDAKASRRTLIKAAQDLFRSKGSELSIDLLFSLVYGINIEIVVPGDKIIRPSQAKWTIPKYLEVIPTSRTANLAGKLVTGSVSGATAFVEYVVTRNVNGKHTDILFLSNINGLFEVGDYITDDGVLLYAPKVSGSYNSIDITLAGQGFNKGEEVSIVSSSGIEGRAIVANVETQTGKITFTLIDGGWGYSLSANGIVSEKVITFSYMTGVRLGLPFVTDMLRAYLNKSTTVPDFKTFLTTPSSTGRLYGDLAGGGTFELGDVLEALKAYLGNQTNTVNIAFLNDVVIPHIRDNRPDIVARYFQASQGSGFVAYDETVEQNNFSIQLNNVTGNFNVGDVLTNHDGANSVIVYKTQTTGSNSATIIINPIEGNTFANTILYTSNQAYVAVNNNVGVIADGTLVRQRTGSTNNAVGIISSASNVTILTINTATIASNGIHVGTHVLQDTTLAKGIVVATPRESNLAYTNVNAVVIGTVNGSFSSTDDVNFYDNAENDTYLSTATPTAAVNGYLYYITSSSGSRWSSSNTIIVDGVPTLNNAIMVAADVGGKQSTNSSVKATGVVLGSNTTAVGLYNTSGTFYAIGTNLLVGQTSGHEANCTFISTGTSGDFGIGSISDTETVLLYSDLMSSNNTGGTGSIKFKDMIITGANSTFNNLHSVAIFNGGIGYSNTDMVVFSGGNTGVGSYTAGNASITTDSSGNIATITLSSNVGNLITTTPSITIANSTGGSSSGSGANVVAASSFGFQKYNQGDLNTPILDLLTTTELEIGTIASLSGVNPGENYNIKPFIVAREAAVAAYGKRDIILNISNLLKDQGFTFNELVEATINTPSISIVSNNYTGNTSLQYDVSEYITTNNGIDVTGTGVVYSTTLDGGSGDYTTVLVSNTGAFSNTIAVSKLTVGTNTGFNTGASATQGSASGTILASNTTTLIIKNVTGTFAISGANVVSGSANTAVSSVLNNTKVYQLVGATSKGVTDIKNSTASTSSSYARGRVKSGSNTSYLKLKRVSLFTDYIVGTTITGATSGEQADIDSVLVDQDSNVIGDNAVIAANVVASTGSVTSLSLVDSGLSFDQDQTATFSSLDGSKVGTGKINLGGVGTGAGYYSESNGLLDDEYYIHDGEYYQEFSYEIQSSKPLETYADVLKQVLHVAGTKFFGRVVTSTVAAINTTAVESSITIS